jgi:hypothetical protein
VTSSYRELADTLGMANVEGVATAPRPASNDPAGS